VEAGADKDKANVDGNTPLLIACLKGHIQAVRLLVEAGADKDKSLTDGSTPLYTACQNGHIEVVRLLVEAGADKEQPLTNGCTPLYTACFNGHIQVVQLLVEAGANKEQPLTNGFTPLYTACFNGHIQAVRLLVEAGADKDKAGTNGFTPLHAACLLLNGHIEVVRLLVEAGTAKDKAGTNGHTPLHCAAFHGHDAICMLLAFEGADLTARTLQNQTPADNAQINGHASLAAHLRCSGWQHRCLSLQLNNGVRCLRCTGPSLERRLIWYDTNQQQQETMLDEMQAQWLARVAEGCAHARVGLTLRGAFNGGLSTCMLLHVMGYVFGGTQVHLQSCISTGRSVSMLFNIGERCSAKCATGHWISNIPAAVDVHGVVVAAAAAGSGRGGSMQELAREQLPLPPKLALVSYALALAATPKPQPIPRAGPPVLGDEARQKLQTVLRHAATRSCEWLYGPPVLHPVLGEEARQQLQTALRQGSSSCEWLHAYCDFLQRRYSLGQ
jgi:ankyrin repeat protein